MNCEKHYMNQIIVKDEMVFNEKFLFSKESCPFCKLEKLKSYFISGNSIPVERATILAKDFWAIMNENI